MSDYYMSDDEQDQVRIPDEVRNERLIDIPYEEHDPELERAVKASIEAFHMEEDAMMEEILHLSILEELRSKRREKLALLRSRLVYIILDVNRRNTISSILDEYVHCEKEHIYISADQYAIFYDFLHEVYVPHKRSLITKELFDELLSSILCEE